MWEDSGSLKRTIATGRRIKEVNTAEKKASEKR
jgi:hypothetical protein